MPRTGRLGPDISLAVVAAVVAAGAGVLLAAAAALVAAMALAAAGALEALADSLTAGGLAEAAAAGADAFCAVGAGMAAFVAGAAGAELAGDCGAVVPATAWAALMACVDVAADGAVIADIALPVGAAGFTPWWAQAAKPNRTNVPGARIFITWRGMGRPPREFASNYSTSK